MQSLGRCEAPEEMGGRVQRGVNVVVALISGVRLPARPRRNPHSDSGPRKTSRPRQRRMGLKKPERSRGADLKCPQICSPKLWLTARS